VLHRGRHVRDLRTYSTVLEFQYVPNMLRTLCFCLEQLRRCKRPATSSVTMIESGEAMCKSTCSSIASCRRGAHRGCRADISNMHIRWLAEACAAGSHLRCVLTRKSSPAAPHCTLVACPLASALLWAWLSSGTPCSHEVNGSATQRIVALRHQIYFST
jgi:hypothetical protein